MCSGVSMVVRRSSADWSCVRVSGLVAAVAFRSVRILVGVEVGVGGVLERGLFKGGILGEGAGLGLGL